MGNWKSSWFKKKCEKTSNVKDKQDKQGGKIPEEKRKLRSETNRNNNKNDTLQCVYQPDWLSLIRHYKKQWKKTKSSWELTIWKSAESLENKTNKRHFSKVKKKLKNLKTFSFFKARHIKDKTRRSHIWLIEASEKEKKKTKLKQNLTGAKEP